MKENCKTVINSLSRSEFYRTAEIIRESFASVAEDLGFTEQNFPTFTGYVTTAERLQNHYDMGWYMYGLYANEQLIGYVSLSKRAESIYELHNLTVLPDFRHKGYGKQLLDFCKEKVKELGGVKIKIDITEENTKLKNWYTKYGFIHTGTKKFGHMPITVGFMELEVN